GRSMCPGLAGGDQHVGLNGNGLRPGLGYCLVTPGGWLAKAGYLPDDVPDFLADLAGLAAVLGLTVVGIGTASDGVRTLDQLRGMAAVPALRPALERMLVRVYTRAASLLR